MMKNVPLVSVVMPVYNGAEYLEEAVNSILGQTLRDFEFIIIDDGSTDSSADILTRRQQSDSRIRVLRQQNRGVAAALNKGFEIAKGKYIARMDSDDISLPERLSKQVAFMETHPEVGICGTGWMYVGDRAGEVIPLAKDGEIRVNQLFWPCMAHPTVMMRRDLVVEHNLYYNPNFKQAEDYELWIRFSRCCEMANIPEPLLLYRICDKQATIMSEAEVSGWSCLVHKEALSSLGIDPSGEELELHRAFAGSDIRKSWDCVNKAEAWLLKLLGANETRRAYDATMLRRLLFECWYSFCSRAAELGLWTWPKFKNSELCAGFNISLRYSVSFASRYLLRRRTRSAYYKLSKLTGIWRVVASLSPRSVRDSLGDAS